MIIEKLIQKAYEFEKKNKSFTWKPKDFPEDMSESRWAGKTLFEVRDILSSANKLKRYDL